MEVNNATAAMFWKDPHSKPIKCISILFNKIKSQVLKITNVFRQVGHMMKQNNWKQKAQHNCTFLTK